MSSAPFFRSLAPSAARNFFHANNRCLLRVPPSAPSTSTGACRAFGAGRTGRTGRTSWIGRTDYAGQLSSVVGCLSGVRNVFVAQVRRLSAETEAAAGAKTGNANVSKTSWPDVSSKGVGYFLLGSAASVFGIVVFGGLTRLTESGLSITEWRPVTGSLPPMNAQDWEEEFAKYRSSPEYQKLNPNMTLSEFKNIYYMEWIHRLWGRFIGVSFVVPAAYFVARKQVSKGMALRLGGIAGLIGFQGFIGWWMVASGLKDDLFSPGSHPRVSQYRLTAHLAAAFVCYTAMLWNGLAILHSHRLLVDPATSTRLLNTLRDPKLAVFRRSVAGLSLLVFVTVLSGALVAGLDAGLIYNDFPFMGDGLWPPVSELLDPHYSQRPDDHADLWWRNIGENPSLVQLDHRILATTTFTSVLALQAYSKSSSAVRALLPRAAARGLHGVVGFACLQVALGISTLWYLVPVPLAAAHQAGALLLLTWVLVLGGRVWLPKRTAALLLRVTTQGQPVVLAGRAGRAGPVGGVKQ